MPKSGQNLGTRDFVAPRQPPTQFPTNPGIPGSQVPKSQNPTSNRDFVNPYFNLTYGNPTTKPQTSTPKNQQNIPQISKPVQTASNTPGGKRDFVNPNYKPTDPFPTLKPVQTPNQPPRDPFPALKPVRTQQGSPQTGPTTSKPRDFVNPNFQPKPREPFPALRPVGQPNLTPGQVQPDSVISYAQKASGGVTTPAPGFVTGPPSATTEHPDDGPNDNELREFSEAILKKDINNAYKYVKLNLQGKTTSHSKNDEAPQP